ncbi:glycosyltransferase [Caldanaerobius polysaccharolyticus]|uniref:glycosyltransferase n=1 Tax=Caldanaerobius polysaccharolyticus TaxID=44256 RepID=UPI000478EF6D|nr:glycosyltransferase [Caldanaerobius polysaccharolyticus]
MNRVLLGSPVKQDYAILKEFLESINNLETEEIELDIMFIDDNDDTKSKRLLKNYRKNGCRIIVKPSENSISYSKDDTTHYWNHQLIRKVAAFKNAIIAYAKENHYDYLFLVDSDLYLHPMTLKQLILSKKDIISEIFWTKWTPDSIELPQVWLEDNYRLYARKKGEILSQEEVNKRTFDFLNILQKPGVYRVGGLGACTLISKKAINAGISFDEIYNISFEGEDRHFCIRAVALGFELFVDTHWPSFHMYRDSDLEELKWYKDTLNKVNGRYNYIVLPNKRRINVNQNSLTLAMTVKDEASRYLTDVLKVASKIADKAVIVDDASNDNTREVFQKFFEGKELIYIVNETSMFNNEVKLRKKLWESVIATNPDWILCLDADEIIEDKIVEHIKNIINQPYYDVMCFRIYDFWDEKHYREDMYWNAHTKYWPFLLRYQPQFNYVWKETPLHCGRFPSNIFEQPHAIADIRVKHMGWSKAEDRIKKYQRYMELDRGGKYGILEQYASILDANPSLKEWIE